MLADYLKKTFDERKAKNPAYSLRAFARSLNMDSSSLSAIMRGKRHVTAKLAKRIIDELGIVDPMEIQTLMMQIISESETVVDDDSLNYRDLAMDAAETVSSWHFFAILATLELDEFVPTESSIAKRLGLTQSTVQDALEKMQRLALVEKVASRWRLTGKNLATSAPVANQSLRAGHRQNISKALQSLDLDPVETRDISGITMAISKAQLPRARKLIQDFRRRMSVFLETGRRNAVYRLNIQLFPLSHDGNSSANGGTR